MGGCPDWKRDWTKGWDRSSATAGPDCFCPWSGQQSKGRQGWGTPETLVLCLADGSHREAFRWYAAALPHEASEPVHQVHPQVWVCALNAEEQGRRLGFPVPQGSLQRRGLAGLEGLWPTLLTVVSALWPVRLTSPPFPSGLSWWRGCCLRSTTKSCLTSGKLRPGPRGTAFWTRLPWKRRRRKRKSPLRAKVIGELLI